MPNFLQSAANAFFAPANWLSSKLLPTPQTPSLFQSRVTHTPGIVTPIDKAKAGEYSSEIDPMQMMAGLTPDQKATLGRVWQPLGKGMIAMQPGFEQDSSVLRHEQIHALQHDAGLNQYSNQISALIDPGLVDAIRSDPTYQQEMKVFGEKPTIADEGSAIQLTRMPYATTTPALQTQIMQHLKSSIQQKQLQRLSAPRDQSQK